MRQIFLASIFAFVVAPATADTLTLPSDVIKVDDRDKFRLCRAAILVEDGLSEEARTRLPPATVSAMREQVTFIMAETVYNAPVFNIEDGQKRSDFAEKFVIEFSRTIAAERERLYDLAERENILMNCQPLLWEIMKEHIDVLMLWRMRAMGLDRPFPVIEENSPALVE